MDTNNYWDEPQPIFNTDTDNSITNGDNIQYGSGPGILSYLVFAVLVTCALNFLVIVVYECYEKFKRFRNNRSNNNRRNNNRRNNNDDDEEDEDETNVSPLAKRNIEELMVVYSEAFDRNKQQIVLDASRILVGNPNTNNEDDDEDDDDEEIQRRNCGSCGNDDSNQHPSIYLALEGARSIRRSTRNGTSIHLPSGTTTTATGIESGDNDQPSGRKNSSVLGSLFRFPQKSTKKPKNNSNNIKTNIVCGTCVVCLEDMHAGEMVVWSETKSCPHVFHKECMVAFLAHNLKQQPTQSQASQNPHNPCPTCRQPFVAV